MHQPDTGTIRIGGDEVSFSHPVQAQQAGLSTVFQEFNLLPERSIAENIYLGREPRRRGLVDTRQMNRDTEQLLDGLGVRGLRAVAPGPLAVGGRAADRRDRQGGQLRRPDHLDGRADRRALRPRGRAALHDHRRTSPAAGTAIIYVSHRLKEIFDLCDTITVLKDGQHVTTAPAADLDDAQVVRLMVGRSISSFFPDPVPGTEVGEPKLELRGAGNGYVDGIDLTLRAGEIVGISGLQGSGRTELLEAIFGIRPFSRGEMLLDGKPARPGRRAAPYAVGWRWSPRTARRPALALRLSILDNALGVVRAVFPRRTSASRREVPGVLSSLDVSAVAMDQEVQFLSGGNQQKVVLARWLLTQPRVVLMDEPTRGIDVGAKHRIYELMRNLAKDGVAVLMVSSELTEVIGMADRIVVMRDGRIAGELPGGSTEEAVLQLATGVEAGSSRGRTSA